MRRTPKHLTSNPGFSDTTAQTGAPQGAVFGLFSTILAIHIRDSNDLSSPATCPNTRRSSLSPRCTYSVSLWQEPGVRSPRLSRAATPPLPPMTDIQVNSGVHASPERLRVHSAERPIRADRTRFRPGNRKPSLYRVRVLPSCDPSGIRTRVAAVRGRSTRPLYDGAMLTSLRESLPAAVATYIFLHAVNFTRKSRHTLGKSQAMVSVLSAPTPRAAPLNS